MNAMLNEESTPARFVKIGRDGEQLHASVPEWVAVLDSKTGLTWSVQESQRMKQPEAIEAAAALDLCGWRWRLPTREELLSLVDDTRYDPAIDAHFFPACHSSWYWSSTPAAFSPADAAWGVLFNLGYAYWGLQDLVGFVRAVRASQ